MHHDFFLSKLVQFIVDAGDLCLKENILTRRISGQSNMLILRHHVNTTIFIH